MMKKLISGILFAAAFAGGFTSCSSDVSEGPSNDGNVSFTCVLPRQMATRTFADGTTATQLTYQVYRQGELETVGTLGTAEFTGLETQITLKLINGKSYDIVFWADAPGNKHYKFDPATQTVTVDYKTTPSQNDETRDAFFAKESFKVDGPIERTITLKRPFAQINFGTNDLNEKADDPYTNLNTGLKLTAYTQLNLLTGEVSKPEDVTYTAAANPTGEDFPVTGYDYLSMNYVLVEEDQAVVDMDFFINNGEEQMQHIDLNAVPVKRNYRTNIYGSLLYSSQDFTIKIDPKPLGESDINLGRNELAEGVEASADNKTYFITSKAGLDWLRTELGNQSFRNKTVKLTADIDLGGKDWTPIYSSANTFNGTFDGQGHTIANMTVKNGITASTSVKAAGFFANLVGYVKNLNFTNANVSGEAYSGIIVGNGTCTRFENCHIKGGSVKGTPYKDGENMNGGHNAGAITGYLCADGGEAWIKNCSVEDMAVEGYTFVGGLTGTANGSNGYTPEVTGNTVSNVTVTANRNVEKHNKASEATLVGVFVGRDVNNIAKLENNTYVNSKAVSLPLLSAALAAGGEISIDVPMKELDLTAAAKEAEVTINAPVGTLKLGALTAHVTVKVAKDVPFPYFDNNATQTGFENFTIEGDIRTSQPAKCITFGGKTVKNVTIKNVAFTTTNSSNIYGYAGGVENLVIDGCKFENPSTHGVSISRNENEIGQNTSLSVTVKNCEFIYGENAHEKTDGIYVLGYNVTIENNIVKNTPYHGIFVRPTDTAVITGNTVIGATQDGIKVEGLLKANTVTITGNKVKAAMNGIRCKEMNSATMLSVTGNEIDMTIAGDYDESKGEPCGILLLGTATPVLTVKDNVKFGTNEHWFSQQFAQTGEGSDFATPYKN